MSKHKVHQHSFSNYAPSKKSSPLIQTRPWTNPYQQKNDPVIGKPAYVANPPTTQEWQKNNILQRVIETRQAQLQQQAIQAKLTVGEPGDKYELEADAMASQVMSMSEPAVQKESEQKLQTKPLAQRITPVVQLTAARNGSIQAKSNLESRLNSSKGGGSPLSNQVRSFMEPRFGADFSQVRVHTDNTAVQMSRELGAQAFTHGSDIYYGEGKSPGNNELTAHELTHVVQQVGSIQPRSFVPAIQLAPVAPVVIWFGKALAATTIDGFIDYAIAAILGIPLPGITDHLGNLVVNLIPILGEVKKTRKVAKFFKVIGKIIGIIAEYKKRRIPGAEKLFNKATDTAGRLKQAIQEGHLDAGKRLFGELLGYLREAQVASSLESQGERLIHLGQRLKRRGKDITDIDTVTERAGQVIFTQVKSGNAANLGSKSNNWGRFTNQVNRTIEAAAGEGASVRYVVDEITDEAREYILKQAKDKNVVIEIIRSSDILK